MGFGTSKMLASADEVRAYALALARAYVPSDYGDDRFSAILGPPTDRAAAKGYSSCGDLVHFLLWSAGVRDRAIVNREPWVPALNISRLVGGAKKLGAWKSFDGTNAMPGDMYFIGGDDTGAEHFGVYLGEGDRPGTWHTADAGQTNAKGQQAARLYPFTDESGKLHERVITKSGGLWRMGSRTIRGLVDLALVPLAEPSAPIPGEPTDEEEAGAGPEAKDGGAGIVAAGIKIAGVAFAAWAIGRAVFGGRS